MVVVVVGELWRAGGCAIGGSDGADVANDGYGVNVLRDGVVLVVGVLVRAVARIVESGPTAGCGTAAGTCIDECDG